MAKRKPVKKQKRTELGESFIPDLDQPVTRIETWASVIAFALLLILFLAVQQ